MADYNLGTARGVIRIDYTGDGPRQATKDLDAAGKQAEKTRGSIDKLGKGMAIAGVAIVAGFGFAVKSAAEFEKGLSAISAVSGATGAEMDQIREKALQLGKETKFSAAESASAMEELVKAGISVADVMGGAADATVALAAAGEISLVSAATIASNAMNQFQLSAQELPRIADVLAGAANVSAIGVTELGESLNYVGPIANATGVSIDDTAAAIAVLGNNGITGSAAGTALRSMLTSLVPNTKRATDEFKKLGLITADGTNQFIDATTGGLKPMNEIVGILNGSMANLSKTERNTFAKRAFGLETLPAVNVLGAQTADTFNEVATAMGEVSAADVAAERMNNLMGRVEELKGSFETLMIVVGTPFLGAVSDVVEGITSLVNTFLELPGPVRDFITIMGLTTGALLLLVGTAIVVNTRLTAMRAQLVLLGQTALWGKIAAGARIATAAIGGPWVAAIIAATAVFGALIAMNRKAKPPIEELTEAIVADSYALGENTRKRLANEASASGLIKQANDLGIATEDLIGHLAGEADATARVEDAVRRLRQPFEAQAATLDKNAAGFDKLSNQHARGNIAARTGIVAVNQFSTALDLQADTLARAQAEAQKKKAADEAAAASAKTTTAAQDTLNASLGRADAKARAAAGGVGVASGKVADLGISADRSEAEIKGLNDAIDKLLGRAFDTPRALIAIEAGLDEITASARESGTSTNINTDAGRRNTEMMFRQVERIAELGEAMRNSNAPTEEVIRAQRRAAREFENVARKAGFTEDQIADVRDTMSDLISQGDADLTITTNAPVATQNIRELERAAEQAAGSYPVRFPITADYQNMGEMSAPALASGGIVRRPTMAWVGEGGSSEAVVPLPDLAEMFLRVYTAGQSAAVVPEAQMAKGKAPQQRSGGSSRLVRGQLTIDRQSRAWITGVAEDVVDGGEAFAATYGRMG